METDRHTNRPRYRRTESYRGMGKEKAGTVWLEREAMA